MKEPFIFPTRVEYTVSCANKGAIKSTQMSGRLGGLLFTDIHWFDLTVHSRCLTYLHGKFKLDFE